MLLGRGFAHLFDDEEDNILSMECCPAALERCFFSGGLLFFQLLRSILNSNSNSPSGLAKASG
jgi:hypothetical protein